MVVVSKLHQEHRRSRYEYPKTLTVICKNDRETIKNNNTYPTIIDGIEQPHLLQIFQETAEQATTTTL
jgi:hypothetical protein